MKIIYHCFGGAHSSVTAAAIHLGQLPEDTIPDGSEFTKLAFYDVQKRITHGNLYLSGIDSGNNQIYILGRRGKSQAVSNLAEDLMRALGADKESIMLVNAAKHVNLTMRIGGLLSRHLGMVKWGRPIVIWGTQKAYPYLAYLVKNVRLKVASDSCKQ
jgi:hypothetical protein